MECRTHDSDSKQNVYSELNVALRNRHTHPSTFQKWKPYLFFLMAALEQLPQYTGVVYRGGNDGIDQQLVHKEYRKGRLIQWSGFSSSTVDRSQALRFVRRDHGVLFKLSVVTGRDIGPYSFFRKENEILISPRTRFLVTGDVYVDDEGYTCVDMMEVEDTALSS